MELPAWEDCCVVEVAERATALEAFIYCNEPEGEEDAAQFRSMLLAVLEEATATAVPQVTHHCPECEAHARLVEMMRRREAPYIEQWRRETGRHDALPDYGDMLKWLMEKVEEARWELGKYIAAYAAGAGRETGGRLPIAGLQPWNIDYTPAPSGDQEQPQ